MALRPLLLPDNVLGKVWLTAMPGRFDPLASFVNAAEAIGATGIVCLTSDAETAQRSPSYAKARQSGTLPFKMLDHPILDFGLPQDAAKFAQFINGLCTDLAAGQRLILHCAAGIGRTGVVAQQMLMAFGVEPEQARAQVLQAGSGGESAEQKEFCNQAVVRFLGI